MIAKVVKFGVGVGLLPFVWATARMVWDLILRLPGGGSHSLPLPALALLCGLVIWIVAFCVLPKPVRSYILAHEPTHALWGMLMGAEVSELRIRRNRGSVQLSRTNFLVTLAPYFFPFYTALLLLVVALAALFCDVGRYQLLWLFLVGVTWGFHLTFTISALQIRQSDIEQHGRLFSYTVIFVMNVLLVGLWLVAVSPIRLSHFGGSLGSRTAEAYGGAARAVATLWYRAGGR